MTAKWDIRYTCSKDGSTLYAIILGWQQGKFSPTILQTDDANDASVQLVEHAGELCYHVNGKRMLTIEVSNHGQVASKPSELEVKAGDIPPVTAACPAL